MHNNKKMMKAPLEEALEKDLNRMGIKLGERELKNNPESLLLERNFTIGNLFIKYQRREGRDEEEVIIYESERIVLNIGFTKNKPIEIGDYFIRTPEEKISEFYYFYPKYKDEIVKIYQKLNDKILQQSKIANILMDFINKCNSL